MIKRLYQTTSLQNVFKRSQLAIFGLTFTICTIIFFVVSAYTMRTYAQQGLVILADALSERIQPAVVFNDKVTIKQILEEYAEEYPIRSINVMDQNNQRLAHIEQPQQNWTPTTYILDRLFFSQPIQVTITHNQKKYGEVQVYGNASNLVAFVHKILLSLSLGFLIILATIFWLVRSIYQYLMNSIHPIVSTARLISLRKNYQIRLPDSPIDEFQDLNIVFNELLEKIQQSNQQLQTENDKLAHQARHDELTQLPNRNFFYQTLFQIFYQPNLQNTALLYIDNNHFKEINDQYGHLAGDAVLKEMSLRLKTSLRQDDFIARFGCYEFFILLKNIQKPEHSISIAKHLLNCCKAPLYYEKTEIHFSFSIGIAFFKCFKSPEDLITAADSAMYKAKLLDENWHIATREDLNCDELTK